MIWRLDLYMKIQAIQDLTIVSAMVCLGFAIIHQAQMTLLVAFILFGISVTCIAAKGIIAATIGFKQWEKERIKYIVPLMPLEYETEEKENA